MIVEDKRPSTSPGPEFSEYYGRTFARRERLNREANLPQKPTDQLSSLTKSKALGGYARLSAKDTQLLNKPVTTRIYLVENLALPVDNSCARSSSHRDQQRREG